MYGCKTWMMTKGEEKLSRQFPAHMSEKSIKTILATTDNNQKSAGNGKS